METNPSDGCAWSGNPDDNCNFIATFNAAIAANGIVPGTYASAYMWNNIAGSGCTAGASGPLWYPHYDGNPDFNDFAPFGGWNSPAIKQYNDGPLECGFGVDWNWYPDGLLSNKTKGF